MTTRNELGRLLTTLPRLRPAEHAHRTVAKWIDGEPGWYITVDGRPGLLLVPSFRDGRAASVLAVLSPDKLARFHATWLAQH